MPVKVCNTRGCGRLIRLTQRFCPSHAAEYERARLARRGDRYDWAHRQRAKGAIAAEPWCHWPGCGRTDDLTADHPDYTVICRSHNSEKANRERARPILG